MMVQQNFSDGEWSALMQAPLQAVMAILLADKTDPVSFLREARAAIQLLSAEQQRQDISNDLVRSLLNGWKAIDAAEPIQGEELMLKKEFELLGRMQTLKDATTGRNQAIDHLQQVTSILSDKVTLAQAQEFKEWLLSVARRVAEMVKEEGIFGIGGERISGQELATLEKLEKALALTT